MLFFSVFTKLRYLLRLVEVFKSKKCEKYPRKISKNGYLGTPDRDHLHWETLFVLLCYVAGCSQKLATAPDTRNYKRMFMLTMAAETAWETFSSHFLNKDRSLCFRNRK